MSNELELGRMLQPSVHVGEIIAAPHDAVVSLAKAVGMDVENLSKPLSSEDAERIVGSDVVDAQAAMNGLRIISNRRTV
jgi:hypothetical protein